MRNLGHKAANSRLCRKTTADMMKKTSTGLIFSILSSRNFTTAFSLVVNEQGSGLPCKNWFPEHL
jgi:hypothetical protein